MKMGKNADLHKMKCSK